MLIAQKYKILILGVALLLIWYFVLDLSIIGWIGVFLLIIGAYKIYNSPPKVIDYPTGTYRFEYGRWNWYPKT